MRRCADILLRSVGSSSAKESSCLHGYNREAIPSGSLTTSNTSLFSRTNGEAGN